MINTLDELQKVVNFALKLGGEFADARLETIKTRQISIVNGSIRSFNRSSREGVAIRVKLASAWGLASTTTLDTKSLANAAKKAFQIAKKSNKYSGEKIVLPEMKAVKKS